jgi:predicted MPP superfamily phosphohydrolase
MKNLRWNRRRFLLAALCLAPGAVLADAKWLEPTWLRVRRLNFARGSTAHRIVHFSDFHHKGDRDYGLNLVRTINALAPEAVFFTGDLVEKTRYLPEALEILSEIKSPIFGVPGNHDYWSRASFPQIARCFEATGGAWLLDEARDLPALQIHLLGATCRMPFSQLPAPDPHLKNVLLMHYPAWAKKVAGPRYDLMLAGHSHGGQVRLPFYGPLMLPYGVDEFDYGSFQTQAGPLYVNPGIGWYPVPIRFNCRPEVTAIEI